MKSISKVGWGLFWILGGVVFTVMTVSQYLEGESIPIIAFLVGPIVFLVGLGILSEEIMDLIEKGVFKEKKFWLSVSAIFIIILSVSLIRKLQSVPYKNITSAVTRSCDYKPSPSNEGASYSPDSGEYHPMVIIFIDHMKQYSPMDKKMYPDEWLPDSVSDIQLIACAKEKQQSVETCSYGTWSQGATVRRVRRDYVVTVVNFKTGEILEKITLEGGNPWQCQQKEEFSDGEDSKRYLGSMVSTQELISALERYAQP